MAKKLRFIYFDPHILVKAFGVDPNFVPHQVSEETKIRRHNLLKILKREIFSLPLEQRKVIYEVFFKHKRITEVVQEMARNKNCNKNTVYNNYYKATISLCKRLNDLNLIDFTNNKVMVKALKNITTEKFYG